MAELNSQPWNGSPGTLGIYDQVNVPATPNGSAIFSATNQSAQNTPGVITLMSGGGAPLFINVPAFTLQPTVVVQNWNGNSLSVVNVSAPAEAPILVQLTGPGLPGVTQVPFTLQNSVSLQAGQTALTGGQDERMMNLVLTTPAPGLTIVGAIGGPADATGNNAFVFALNAEENTGGDTGVAPPSGYTATTTSDSYTYAFWGGSQMYIANLSPSTAVIDVLVR